MLQTFPLYLLVTCKFIKGVKKAFSEYIGTHRPQRQGSTGVIFKFLAIINCLIPLANPWLVLLLRIP